MSLTERFRGAGIRSRRGWRLAAPVIFVLAALGGSVFLAQTPQRQTPLRGRTANPHGTISIPCQSCHSTDAWRPLRAQLEFDHTSKTSFPLRGAHRTVNCRDCHVSLHFANTPAACADCHPDIHRREFGASCERCHTERGWHVQLTAADRHSNRFPLIGAHATAACIDCHTGMAAGLHTGMSTQCSSCHLTDYQRAKTVDHKAAGFPLACETCHAMDRWNATRFNGNAHAATGFPLTGAHAGLACSTCHLNNNFNLVGHQCATCHIGAYNATSNPNHVAAGFPRDCAVCHGTAAWTGAAFNHAQTGFTLTGAHATAQCSQCHINNNFSLSDPRCAACHLDRYKATTNPNHQAANFPQDCSICHSTSSWSGATFNHANTRFPLTGAHQTVACSQCHVNSQFAGTPTDCYSCHASEYRSVSNPNHIAAAFPTTCATCHTTSSWSGATFNHTRFPIYSGSHAGKWSTCADCHTNSADFQVFSCINCHAHDRAQTDQDHTQVRNYVYNSANCYACHPQGRS